MSGLLIRNLPESLHERLKERALRNQRSIDMEAVFIIEQALDDRADTPTIADIDRIRVRGTKPLTQDLLDKAREEGRP
jgi:plasmid stability protein